MTPQERDLAARVNAIYDLLVALHHDQHLELNQPLMLCAYDEVNNISTVINFFYLPGRHTPEDILGDSNFTSTHLKDKPTLTLVPKDTK